MNPFFLERLKQLSAVFRSIRQRAKTLLAGVVSRQETEEAERVRQRIQKT